MTGELMGGGDEWTELLMVLLWSSGRTRSKNTEFEASHQIKIHHWPDFGAKRVF